MPSLAASSWMDWVSAMRNGLASFSDWEKPTIAFFRSIFGVPLLQRAAGPGRRAGGDHLLAPGAGRGGGLRLRGWRRP